MLQYFLCMYKEWFHVPRHEGNMLTSLFRTLAYAFYFTPVDIFSL